MTTDCKVTELFCIIDEFCKHFASENAGNLLEDNSGVKRRRRAASLSDSEIMTILLYFHFGTFRNFKHYYLFFIKGTMKSYFPKAVSYNRFVELESRVFFQLMFFLNPGAFGMCTGITFVDSTMIPVCHNLRRYANKVFTGLAKRLYGKLFADKGYISQKLFDFLFEDGIQLVTGLRVNMKNKLIPFYDRMMLHKRYINETINDMLKNTAQIVHSRHFCFEICFEKRVRTMVFVLKSAYKTIVMRFIRFLIVRLYELSRKIVDSTRDFALFWKFLIKTADKRERSLVFAVGNHNFAFSSH